MIGTLALRSLTAHPVRSAVLAAGFGVGVSVMAILLGVAGIVLEQAQSPALAGGGDVTIRLSPASPARLVLSGTLQTGALRHRVRAAGASHTTELYLLNGGKATRVDARGGIPSLERAVGDPESLQVPAWHDTERDTEWVDAAPDKLLRQIDRFHGLPDVPAWSNSWAEWLYFNGRSADARFYVTFIAGPRTTGELRSATVHLQIERNGQTETFGAGTEVRDSDLTPAPDLTFGANSVRLDGMRYRVHLDVIDAQKRRAVGDFTLEASPGRLVPPFEVNGARGWRTGYVVPVMSGTLDGMLSIDGQPVSLAGGTGYHDHNWGFWQGVSWQWGQAQLGDLSIIFGRVFPPREAADPDTIPGLVVALGPDGPIGYSTDVRITEANDEGGRPRHIAVRARGHALDLDLTFDVASTVTSTLQRGPLGSGTSGGVDFLQMRGEYTVKGKAGARTIEFTAPGAAETFRGK
jgi:hypothetical protein